MQTEKTLASDLLRKARAEGLAVDALLALLAYSVQEEIGPLMEARAQGAEIGPVGTGAYALRERAEEVLRD